MRISRQGLVGGFTAAVMSATALLSPMSAMAGEPDVSIRYGVNLAEEVNFLLCL